MLFRKAAYRTGAILAIFVLAGVTLGSAVQARDLTDDSPLPQPGNLPHDEILTDDHFVPDGIPEFSMEIPRVHRRFHRLCRRRTKVCERLTHRRFEHRFKRLRRRMIRQMRMQLGDRRQHSLSGPSGDPPPPVIVLDDDD